MFETGKTIALMASSEAHALMYVLRDRAETMSFPRPGLNTEMKDAAYQFRKTQQQYDS